MYYQLDDTLVGFPNPEEADKDGLIAVGGKLTADWLLEAYCSGIFPWFEDKEVGPAWFSPDPRMVLTIKDFRPHKSLSRVVRSGRFEVQVDTCFEQVIQACRTTPRNYPCDGSWINDHFIQAYGELFQRGIAHSFETFLNGQLVGGLYGVSLGDWFFGESMFHRVTDASKVAFCAMVDYCRMHGLRYVDCQMETSHLASLGARLMPRKEFLKRIYSMPQEASLVYRWGRNSVALLLGSNMNDREFNLQLASALVEVQVGHIACETECIETEPWGHFDEDETQPFLNQALIVDTDLQPEEVLREVLAIEAFMGRERNEEAQGYQSRPIDIDIIFYNNEVVNTPDLVVPHPRAHLRSFVLEPLSKLIPDYLHPTLHLTVSELLARV